MDDNSAVCENGHKSLHRTTIILHFTETSNQRTSSHIDVFEATLRGSLIDHLHVYIADNQAYTRSYSRMLIDAIDVSMRTFMSKCPMYLIAAPVHIAAGLYCGIFDFITPGGPITLAGAKHDCPQELS